MGVVSKSRLVRHWVVAFGMGLFGCASHAPAPGSSTPQIPSAKATSAAQPAPVPPDTASRGLLRVRVEPDRVLLDDRLAAALERGQVRRIEPFFEAMKERRQRPNEDSLGALYQLSVADEVDGAQLKSAFQTAAFSGWQLAELDVGGPIVMLHAVVPSPSGKETTFDLAWPEEALVIVVHADTVDLWRAKATPKSPASKEPAAEPAPNAPAPAQDEPAKRIGTVLADDIPTGVPALLRTACERGPACSPAVLYVANDATFFLVRRTLQALSTTSHDERRPIVQLRLSKPEPAGTPPRVRFGTTVSGRLPPEVIQRIMRGNFEYLRRCYEAGLARDPALTGKVVVRFVIGRSGAVIQAGTGKESTMPDSAVTECVVQHVRTMQFPQPEGGIVTVVYPIVFEPG